MLQLDKLVGAKIGDIGRPRLEVRLEEYPADMSPQDASIGVVGVAIRVGVSMVGSMRSCPPMTGALYSAGTTTEQEHLEREGSII